MKYAATGPHPLMDDVDDELAEPVAAVPVALAVVPVSAPAVVLEVSVLVDLSVGSRQSSTTDRPPLPVRVGVVLGAVFERPVEDPDCCVVDGADGLLAGKQATSLCWQITQPIRTIFNIMMALSEPQAGRTKGRVRKHLGQGKLASYLILIARPLLRRYSPAYLPILMNCPWPTDHCTPSRDRRTTTIATAWLVGLFHPREHSRLLENSSGPPMMKSLKLFSSRWIVLGDIQRVHMHRKALKFPRFGAETAMPSFSAPASHGSNVH